MSDIDDLMRRLNAEQTGQLDQAQAAFATLAQMLMDFYTALRQAGFDQGQALQIVLGYQTAMLPHQQPPPEGPEAPRCGHP